MSETMLRKNQCIPFMNTGSAQTPSWARIDKSTIFSLNPNPQTETQDYICYETPVTVIDHYEPELPQEIAMYEGNPMYDFVYGLFYNLPVGEEAVVESLICFPGTDKKAWKIDETTLVLGEMNTVDKKISFTLNFGGDITRGTYTISTSGKPSFSAASA